MKAILVDAVATFVIEVNNKFIIHKEVYDLLESFPNPKFILTNANQEQMKQFGLVDMPYEVFSLNHSPNKSDPMYFKKMLEYFDLTATGAIYIEHNEDAVASAQSIGINSYWYNSVERDMDALHEFLGHNL